MCAEAALDGQNMILAHADYERDIGPHRGAHFLMMMYAVFNVLVASSCMGEEISPTILFVPVLAILELVSRNYIVTELGRRARLAREANRLAQIDIEPQQAVQNSFRSSKLVVGISSRVEGLTEHESRSEQVMSSNTHIQSTLVYFCEDDSIVRCELVTGSSRRFPPLHHSSINWLSSPIAPDAEDALVHGNKYIVPFSSSYSAQ